MRHFAFFGLVALSGCYTQPYDWQITNNAPFWVTGYTDDASASVVVEMQNGYNGPWVQVGSATSSATATYSAGAWSNNSPALYYYSTTVSAPVWVDGKIGELRVRNLTENETLYGGTVNSLSCFLNTITRTADFYGVAWNCGYNLGQVNLDNGNIR